MSHVISTFTFVPCRCQSITPEPQPTDASNVEDGYAVDKTDVNVPTVETVTDAADPETDLNRLQTRLNMAIAAEDYRLAGVFNA